MRRLLEEPLGDLNRSKKVEEGKSNLRKITWEEHLKGWWPLYLVMLIIVMFLSVTTIMLVRGGFWISVFIVVCCVLLFWFTIASSKQSLRIHSCGKLLVIATCPNCGTVCGHCGKKVEGE